MDEHVTRCRVLQRALFTAEEDVIEIEGLLADLDALLTSSEVRIDPGGTVRDVAPVPDLATPRAADGWTEGRQRAVDAVVEDVETILAEAAAVDSAIAEAVPAGDSRTNDLCGTESPEVGERWAELSQEERQAVLEQLIREHAEENDVEPLDIVFTDLGGGTRGQWQILDGRHVVSIDLDSMENPHILHTAAHEVRHARQWEATEDLDGGFWPAIGLADDPFEEHEDDGITREEAERWQEEFTDDSDLDHEEYLAQSIEEDARETGTENIEDMTVEEIDRLLEEAGR